MENDTLEKKRHPSLAMLDEKPFLIMGVVNVTPDSFFDGGKHFRADAAKEHALQLVNEGADIIDIGGESSRPGAAPVTAAEELSRVIPVIEQVRAVTGVPISIDTTKAAVARQALGAGATWINDISAGRFDTQMAPTAARSQCPVVLMHSRNSPADMQKNPSYHNVLQEVRDELLSSVTRFTDLGVLKENIIIDPGIGFAKRFEDNCALLRSLNIISDMGFPVLIGTSRKSFIGQITAKTAEHRLYGSLASIGAAYTRGAKIFRVHDVAATVDFLNVLSTIEKSP